MWSPRKAHILCWQSEKMAPRPDVVLQNILKNATDGTYGLVAVLNATLTAERLKANLNDSLGDSISGNSSSVKELETTTSHSLLNDSLSSTENDELFAAASSSNASLLDCITHPGNMTVVHKPTNLAEIPVKEILIVLGMLGLWFYSIVLTRKAWYRILKE